MGISGEAIAEIDRELREECGVFAIWSPEPVRQGSRIVRGLNMLQHRGQDACGIVLFGDEQICTLKNAGKVEDIQMKICKAGRVYRPYRQWSCKVWNCRDNRSGKCGRPELR